MKSKHQVKRWTVWGKRPPHSICRIIFVMAPCHPNVECYFSNDTKQLKPILLLNVGEKSERTFPLGPYQAMTEELVLSCARSVIYEKLKFSIFSSLKNHPREAKKTRWGKYLLWGLVWWSSCQPFCSGRPEGFYPWGSSLSSSTHSRLHLTLASFFQLWNFIPLIEQAKTV